MRLLSNCMLPTCLLSLAIAPFAVAHPGAHADETDDLAGTHLHAEVGERENARV